MPNKPVNPQPEGADASDLEPIPQSAFDGEVFSTEIKDTPCDHYLVKSRPDTVSCTKCHNSWTDIQFVPFEWVDGKLVE